MSKRSSQRGAIQPWTSVILSAALVFASLFTNSVWNSVVAQTPEASFTISIGGNRPEAAGPVPLELTAPGGAQVGERVTFTLKGRGLRGLAGFQVALKFDAAGLDFAMAELSGNLPEDRTIQVGPVESQGVVYMGAASCPVEGCGQRTDYRSAERRPALLAGDPELATFVFYVRAPGDYHIQVDEIRLFDAAGRSITAAGAVASAADALPLERFDLTGNSLVNDSDAYELLAEWSELAKTGECLRALHADYDLDGSGCLDAADIQVLLSHWGEFTYPSLAEQSDLQLQAVNAVFVVNSAGDESDDNLMDNLCHTAAGTCTLRAAVEQANVTPGHDTIQFAIPSGGSCPVVTISPSTTITIDDLDQAGMTIDGYTQCGASPNTEPVHGNARIRIELKGTLTVGVSGLVVNSGNNVIRGLALYHWSDQLVMRGSRATNNRIEGNIVGANAALNNSGTVMPGESEGIVVGTRATKNIIGGLDPSQRNIVTGNDQDGIGLEGAGVSENVVINNYIGVVQDGVSRLQGSTGNRSDGIDIAAGATNNRIGGTDPRERNVISGNNKDGIEISHLETTRNNLVIGNFIGLGADGVTPVGNHQRGITFEDLPNQNTIRQNVISGNFENGVRFYTANDNLLEENFLGVLPPGLGPGVTVPSPSSVDLNTLIPMPNGAGPSGGSAVKSGIRLIGGSQSNRIQRNIIANHPGNGIRVDSDPGYLANPPTSFPPSVVCMPHFNTFSQNWIFGNSGLGIDLRPGDCLGEMVTPNQNIQPPQISSANTTQVSGTACPNCIVELFISDKENLPDASGENAGEGKLFVAQGSADGSGNFSIPVSGLVAGMILTATATDGAGNTSEFAQNVTVSQGPPSTQPPTGPPPTQPPGTPSPTEPPPAGGAGTELFLPLIHSEE